MLPNPDSQPPLRLSRESYERALNEWQRDYPETLKVETLARSAEGYPIFLLRITDPAVPPGEKQVVLITALHSGSERAGTAGVLAGAEWLLGSSPEAGAARRAHIILCMPMVNPGGYFLREGTEGMMNAARIDPYTGMEYPLDQPGWSHWDVAQGAFINEERAPEVFAVRAVFDRYTPEVHLDLHGVTLEYEGQFIQPSLGSAGSNFALRPWDHRFLQAWTAAMNGMGQSGYAWEADAQRLFAGEPMQKQTHRFWESKALFYTAMYSYLHYHTLPIAVEVPWSEHAVAAIRGLLEVGMQKGAFPVEVIKSVYGGFCIKAGGGDRSQRRASRVALWRRQEEFSVGFLYPSTDGRELYVAALSPAATALLKQASRELAPGQGTAVDAKKWLALLSARKAERADVDLDAIDRFIASGPPQQNRLAFAWGQEKEASRAASSDVAVPLPPLELEFRIYAQAPILQSLALNGISLRKEQFQARLENGATCITIPIEVPPPHGLLIVTCGYDPGEPHTYGWVPPHQRV